MNPPAITSLVSQRCHFHTMREAVARCPECQRYFCRECITEHDDRIICASCLQKIAVKKRSTRKGFAGFGGIVKCAVGIVVAWFFFYTMGRLVLLTPAKYHEGTVWESEGEDR